MLMLMLSVVGSWEGCIVRRRSERTRLLTGIGLKRLPEQYRAATRCRGGNYLQNEPLRIESVNVKVIPSVFDADASQDPANILKLYSHFGITTAEEVAAFSGLGAIPPRQLLRAGTRPRRVAQYPTHRRAKSGKKAKHGKKGAGAVAYRFDSSLLAESRKEAFITSAITQLRRRVWDYKETCEGHHSFVVRLAEIHCPDVPGALSEVSIKEAVAGSVSFSLRVLALGVGGGLTSEIQAGRSLSVRDGHCHAADATFEAEIYRYRLKVLGKIAKKGLRIKPLPVNPSLTYVVIPRGPGDQPTDAHGCNIPTSQLRGRTGTGCSTVDMTRSDASSVSATDFEWATGRSIKGQAMVTLPLGEVGYHHSVSVSRSLNFHYECPGGHFYGWYRASEPNAGYLWTTRP